VIKVHRFNIRMVYCFIKYDKYWMKTTKYFVELHIVHEHLFNASSF